MNDLGYKNESAKDKIDRLENEMNKTEFNITDFKQSISKENLDLKDKNTQLDYDLKEAIYKLNNIKELLSNKNEANNNLETKFNIESSKLYDERDLITNENRR